MKIPNSKFQNLRFKSFFLSIITLLLLTNCQVEETATKVNGAIEKELQITDETFDELMMKKEFRKIFEKLPFANSNKQKKTFEISNENYQILKQPAKVIEHQNKTSYTFLISREIVDNSFFENLVIEIDSLKNSKSFIIKYIPTKLIHKLKNQVDFEGEIEVTPIINDNKLGKINYQSVFCFTEIVSACNGNPWDCGGSICGYYSRNTCVTLGGSSSALSFGTSSTSSFFDPSSGGGGSISNSSVITSPNLPNDDEVIRKLYNTFLTTLNKNQYCFLGLNPPFNQDVINYLIENEFTSTNRTIAKELINTAMNTSDAGFAYIVMVDPSFKNTPCLYNIYTALGGSPSFQNYLQKFDSNFSVANLKLSVGAIPEPNSEASAIAFEPINYLIEIRFNPSKLNSPQLNIVRTFIHEMIHAEMYRKLLSVAGKPNIPWSASFIKSIKDDYPGIADYYTRYKYNVPAGQEPSSAQHQLMAQHSRDIIIQVMQQFDNNQHSLDFYNALSWIGLMGSGIVDENITGLPPQPTVAWANIPQSERLRILTIYSNFKYTNPPCQ